MADQNPERDVDQQDDARTTEVYGGEAGDEPVGEDTEKTPARDEGREGGGVVEERIEEVKRKAEEMASGESGETSETSETSESTESTESGETS